MAQKSKIQWTDGTWNPAYGCTKVSPGCKFCYMMRDMGPKLASRGIEVNGTVTRSKTTFFDPLRWQAQGLKSADGGSYKVFTSSLTDLFHPAIDAYRAEIWDIIKSCPDLIFQILTKRPERMFKCLPSDWGNGYDNVWLGVSVEDQQRADERIPILYFTPAKVRFISIEPLIGPIKLNEAFFYPVVTGYLDNDKIIDETVHPSKLHWVIIGGESGNETGPWGYRATELDWIKSLVLQLKKHAIPTFVKQLGTYQKNLWKPRGCNLGKSGEILDNLPKGLKFLNLREMPKAYGYKESSL